jgi:hypothetical protein
MIHLKHLLCATLAASLLLPGSEAEARFGKRSNSSDSEKKEKKEKKQDKDDDDDDDEKRSSGRVHDASAVDTSKRTHDASAVGSRPPPPPPPPRDSGPDTVIIVEQPPPAYYVPPPAAYVAPDSELSLRPQKDTVYNPMRLALGGGPLGGGVGIDLMLTFEGEQMGLDGRVLGMALPTDDGTEGTDGITVAGAHLTYALVAHDRLRLRVEGGVTTARAPEISFVGPSVATSFDARLVPALDFESRLQLTPFPYRQIDAQAGLSYEPYPWALRAGWRALLLDDAGLVDGVVHRDFFNGPYISFGLFL